MPASVGQIITTLNQAERDLAAIAAQGILAAGGLSEAAATVKAAGAGVPNPELATNIGAHQRVLQDAFKSVTEVAPLLRQASTDVQAAFGRRR